MCSRTGEPVGEALTAADRELNFQVNGVHTARVVLPLTDAQAGSLTPSANPAARLKVYRERTAAEVALDPTLTRELVFYGSLPPQNVRENAREDRVEAVFADPRWVLAQRFTLGTETYTAQDQGTILWGLVDTQNTRSGGDTFLTQGAISTGTVRTVAYDRRRVADAIGEMVKFIDGPDVDVTFNDGWATSGSTNMGTFNVYARQGSTRDNATFTYGHQIGSNVQNIRRDYRETVTYATVIGSDSGSAPISASSGSPSTSPYGVLEFFTSLSDFTTAAFMQFYASGVVQALQTPREVITVEGPTVEAPQPFVDYELGDTVFVSCRKGGMVFTDRALRVHGINVKLSQNGTEDTTLTTAEL